MKTYKQLLEKIDETLSFLEEVEGLDEANENFHSNSKAHQAAKAATKGWKAKNSKATYHPDGTATIHTNTVHSMPAHAFGHHTGVETRHSHEVVNAHLKNAGGEHGHSREELDNHHQKINGVNWKVKGKSQSHEIHLSEEVEQTHEALKGNQHKIDANKNGKVDGHDFKILRNAKKARYQ